jgi:hypothetical protein
MDDSVESLGQRSPAGLVWQTSSACPNGASCVEIALIPNGGAAMRDNKNPQSPELHFDRGSWSAFIAGARSGEFASGASA